MYGRYANGILLYIKHMLHRLLVKLLHTTRHKIGYFGDVPQANLLAWYEENKT